MSELALRVYDGGKAHRRREGMLNAAACGYVWWPWVPETVAVVADTPPEDLCKRCWPGRAR